MRSDQETGAIRWLSVTAIGAKTKGYVSSPREKQRDESVNNMRITAMRDQYDFSNSVTNPYVKKLKKQITIRLDEDVLAYFKALSETSGVPYQNLINLYLKDCASKEKELKIDWK